MKYLDKNTYEIIDSDNYILVDDDIAEAISILNKKGYHTLFSCSGHFDGRARVAISSIDKLDEIKKCDYYTIGHVFKDSFEFFFDYSFTGPYILFDQYYEFLTLPNNLNYENDDGKGYIGKVISFYDENGIPRERNSIEKEVREVQKSLLDWAKELPNKESY